MRKYKKTKLFFMTFFILTVGMLLSLTVQTVINNNNIIKLESQITKIESNKQNEVKVNNLIYDLEKNLINNMQEEMQEIEVIKDKKEWFTEYKKIINKYSNIIDPPETIYDYYSEKEIYLIQMVVETECYDQDFDSKVNVASVILNRINAGGDYGKTVEDVITKRNQFSYNRKDISENTKLAVEYAFCIEDTTNNSIAFRSDKVVDNWYDWEYVFTDNSGHSFYKEREE